MDIRPAVVNKKEKGDQIDTDSIMTNTNGEVVYKKDQQFCNLQDGPVGTVQIGVDSELIYVPGSAT